MDINTANPLKVPYQTGSYLIFDNTDGKTNFRSGMSLPERPYRASGSHQVDLAVLDAVLREAAASAEPAPTTMYLVDLRQETHGYMDLDGALWGRAVSWYADNDWGNVGQSDWWVEEEERLRMRLLAHQARAHIFSLVDDLHDNRAQERQVPVSDELFEVVSAYTESRAATMLEAPLGCPIVYMRMPVTDHCAPHGSTLRELKVFADRVEPTDWVHFHCHGGDGRTTTFLALWDMLCWEGPLPSLEEFAARQYELFPYHLAPGPPSDDWKYSLAVERWDALARFRDQL